MQVAMARATKIGVVRRRLRSASKRELDTRKDLRIKSHCRALSVCGRRKIKTTKAMNSNSAMTAADRPKTPISALKKVKPSSVVRTTPIARRNENGVAPVNAPPNGVSAAVRLHALRLPRCQPLVSIEMMIALCGPKARPAFVADHSAHRQGKPRQRCETLSFFA
jgi:hypothetical protein